ncbi:MAG: hypothetical protein V1776_04845 [Candidatus Diapherotrites archaeon]
MALSLSPSITPDIFGTIIHFLFIFFLTVFLSVAIYWFNRTGKIPSLRIIFKTTLTSLKLFPRIFCYRVRIAPTRLLHKINPKKYPTVNAYPSLGRMTPSSKAKKKTNSRRKIMRVSSGRKSVS